MKKVIYICDWCSVEALARDEDMYPNGWTDGEYGAEGELLCVKCAVVVREERLAMMKSLRARLMNPRKGAG
jgi:hypothetical protein